MLDSLTFVRHDSNGLDLWRPSSLYINLKGLRVYVLLLSLLHRVSRQWLLLRFGLVTHLTPIGELFTAIVLFELR